MTGISFRALRVKERNDGQFSRAIETRSTSELPEGDVLINVKYAALNYKDALSASGHKGITKKYPHTPGVDASGVVESSTSDQFESGDEVIVTGYDFGMNTDGGFSEYIRVPAEWVVPLPSNLDLQESMIIGTAGLTAGIGLYKMQQMGQAPERGSIVITGSTGGVGSMAVGIFSKAGYEVVASTGSEDMSDYLKLLGASQVVDRSFVKDDSGRPLLRSKWAGAFDTVGGNTLHTLIKACKKEGCVVSCGLVESHELNMTVYPFLLNGINVLGVETANYPHTERLKIWEKLSKEWKVDFLKDIVTICSLEELDSYISKILKGGTKGRVVVQM